MTKLNTKKLIRGNHKIVRHINRAAILNLIREHQPIPRIALSRLSNLNKSTVSSIVSDLLEEKLIYETPSEESTGGRKPILLRLNRSEYLIGAIDFDPDCTFLAIGDIEANVVRKKAIRTDRSDPENFIRRCLMELDEIKAELRHPELRSIGVSVPGIVDVKRGVVVVAPDLEWRNIDIGCLVEEMDPDGTNGSLIIENEANASALAELWFGQELRSHSNMVFISEGIGTGIILQGQLIQGSFQSAGQFGHMTIQADGELCICGNRGCWEVYASNTATVQRYYESQNQTFDGDPHGEILRIVRLAHEGDERAVQAIRETGRYLGIGISNIIKGIDPEVIVLGGAIIEAWDLIYPEIRQAIQQRVFFGLSKGVRIIPTSLHERPSLVGAFTLVIKEVFGGYRITK